MKRILISLILLGACPLEAVLFHNSQSSEKTVAAHKNSLSKGGDTGIVHVDTLAALQVYQDCINGASGDFSKTGCKSEYCWRTCEAIAHKVDAAKKEKIYQHFSACTFRHNELRHGRWNGGCHIRKKRCWSQCLAEARERAEKNIPARSYPHPQIPSTPQPKPVHKKAVVDTVTKTTDTPQQASTSSTSRLFSKGNS